MIGEFAGVHTPPHTAFCFTGNFKLSALGSCP
jgi:hypothetical protein